MSQPEETPPTVISALKKIRAFISRSFCAVENYILYESTFFRLHLAAFTFIPLIASAIFWGCNGRFQISYLDSLFLCYSAMTVTGLSTVNLSTLTAWQQIILYLLMMIGDITIVSWIMVLVRKEYFKRHCEWIYVKKPKPMSRRSMLASISSPRNFFKARQSVSVNIHDVDIEKPAESAAIAPEVNFIGPTPRPTLLPNALGLEQIDNDRIEAPSRDVEHITNEEPILSDARTFTSSPAAQSIALDSPEHRPNGFDSAYCAPLTSQGGGGVRRRTGAPAPKRTTILTTNLNRQNTHFSGHHHTEGNFGGFPGPFQLMQKAAKKVAPNTYRKLERKMTVPYMTTTTIENLKGNPDLVVNETLTITVGRNSDIHVESLPDEVIEQIGGAEYKALRCLSYLVPIYFVTTQLVSYLLFAPWLSVTHTYDGVFESQFRAVSKPWFSLFQVMGAYTGGGLSLVDLGMIPFQTAYLMTISLMFVILAGNHALPIFLRLIIWIGSKVAPPNSDARIAFNFLLHHPRRCFIYLFPSHQTWFLLICLVGFSTIEWVLFEVLNIGLPPYESLSTGARIVCGVFQGLAARASGFSIVPVASLAPALQFLYVVMMYIAVYPVAMSIRSTNVYEEKSLGAFEPPPEDEDEEPDHEDLKEYRPRQRVGRYVGWHLRRQMSIDIWWLVWAIFLIAIIERGNIMNEDLKWFDLFRILFELVSAFGGIGLSLGLPSDNFSFAGALHPLSKLVIIVIMVRGRHRGLPVQVDKAVMLPSELVTRDQNQHQHQNAVVSEVVNHDR